MMTMNILLRPAADIGVLRNSDILRWSYSPATVEQCRHLAQKYHAR